MRGLPIFHIIFLDNNVAKHIILMKWGVVFLYRFSYRKIVAIFIFLGLLLGMVGGQASASVTPTVKIIINGREIASDCEPVIINDRTYVPLRVVSENLGAQVTWKEDTKQVIINWHTAVTPNLPANKTGDIQIVIDGQPLVIPSNYGKAFVNNIKGRTMIPLNAISTALDCDVKWIAASYTVDIRSKATISTDDQLLMDLARYQTNLKLIDGSVINSGDLLNSNASSFSAEQLAVFKANRDELSKYGATVTLPTGEIINSKDLTIMGNSYLTAAQLRKWVTNETARLSNDPSWQGQQLKPIPDLADLYIKIGAEYGIRGDLAFCQAAKETGYWQFTGSVQPWQNNYCGLWAIGSPLTGLESCNGANSNLVCFAAGVHGAIFTTPAAGVEAHIQHLYAYANKNSLPPGKVLIDPRFSLVSRGIAPSWLGLNARWAVPGTTYGQSIINDYWLKAVKTI